METQTETVCPDLGQTEVTHKLPAVTAQRMLSAARAPELHRAIGAAILLLIRILERCGERDECEMNYTDMAAELGIPVPTLKKWAKDLEDHGYITKSKSAHGTRVSVLLDKLPGTALAILCGKDDNGQLRETIRGLRSTMNAALDGVMARIVNANGGGAAHEG